MIIRTDARVKNGKSVHSFWIKSWKGETLFEKTFMGLDEKSTEAELHTIIKALQFIQERDIDRVKVITDCKPIVNAIESEGESERMDVTLLKHLLKTTKSKLIWKPREQNKRCDSNCRNPLMLYKGSRRRKKVRRGV